MKKPEWRVRSSSYIVDSAFLRLRKDEIELPDGTVVEDYYVRESPGFVMIFPITADGDVVITRQYRYASDAIHLELPAGMLDAGEDPLDCARRELFEETGYEAECFTLLGTFFAEPVRSTSRAYLFIAHNARKKGEQMLDPTEHIDVEHIPVVELSAMLREGKIDSLSSVGAIYLALDMLKNHSAS